MGIPSKTSLLSCLKDKTVLACLAAICVARFSTTVLNMGIYPDVAAYFAIAREINTYAGVVAMIVLAMVAGKKPALIDSKTFSAIAAVLLVLGCVMLAFAIPADNKLLTIISLGAISIARDWIIVMLYVALSSLKDRSKTIVAVGGGVLAGFLLYPISALLSATGSIIVYCALPCLLIAPLYKASSSAIHAVVSGKPIAEMRIMNPFSFLGPTHPVLVAILLFNIAFGFSLSLNIQQTTPVGLSLIGAVFVLISAAILFSRRTRAIDSLFSLSALLVVGGYIASIAFIGSSNPLANTILTAGSALFSILTYLVISAAIARNPWGMIPLAAWTIAFGGLGTAVGADIGHILNSVAAHNPQAAVLTICIVLMLFISYLWLAMRNFSFEQAVEGVVSVQEGDPKIIDDRFEGTVVSIGKSRGLTERETEILLLLAKGRNSVFLQEYFVVSKNTIKTHIKHIYRKIDIHSQQELIDLIERASG